MGNIEELNKNLDSWAESVKLSTHQELAKASFLAILRSSIIVDKFSNWLLLTTGAVTALLISNISSVSTALSISVVKTSLFILIISGVFGFIVKVFSIYINIFISVTEDINNLLISILNNHDTQEDEMEKVAGNMTEPPDMKIDFNLVLEEMGQPFPKWYKKKLFKAAEETEKDALWGYKRNIKLYIAQSLSTICQTLTFTLFAIIVATSL